MNPRTFVIRLPAEFRQSIVTSVAIALLLVCLPPATYCSGSGSGFGISSAEPVVNPAADGASSNGSTIDGQTTDKSTMDGSNESMTDAIPTHILTTDRSTTARSTTDRLTTDRSKTGRSTIDRSTTNSLTTHALRTHKSITQGTATDGSTGHGSMNDAMTTHLSTMTEGSTTDESMTERSTTDTLIYDPSMNSTISEFTDDDLSSNLPAAVPTVSNTTPPKIPCLNITQPYKSYKFRNVSNIMGPKGVEKTATLLKLTIVGTCNHKEANSPSSKSKRNINDGHLKQFSSSWQYFSRLNRRTCWIGTSVEKCKFGSSVKVKANTMYEKSADKCEFGSSVQVETNTTYDESSCQITSTISLVADQGFKLVGTFELSGISYSCQPEPGSSGGADASGPSRMIPLPSICQHRLSLPVGEQKIPENATGSIKVGLALVIVLVIVVGIVTACGLASKLVKCNRKRSWAISISRNSAVPPADGAVVAAADAEAGTGDGMAPENGENHAGRDEIQMKAMEIDESSSEHANGDHDNDMHQENHDQSNQNEEVKDEQKSLTEGDQELGN